MGLNRFDADIEVIGNLLVEAACHDALQHLGFARGELAHQQFARAGLLVLGKSRAGAGLHFFDQGDQLVFVKRFLDEVERAFFHGLYRHGHVAVRGDEDDGQGRLALDQLVLQLQTAHALHADVDKKAGNLVGVKTAQERFG